MSTNNTNNTLTNLVFNYDSTAKIRFKRENVLACPEHPLLYGVVTQKLSFTIPRKFTILDKKYLYIPKQYYMTILDRYYHELTLKPQTK